MAIAEFRTRVQTRKRIQIPKKINIQDGEEVIVKIYRIDNKGEASA